MSKNLRKFGTTVQYNAYTADTANFIRPNLSLINETRGVAYNPKQSIKDAVITCNSATYNGETQIATNIVVTLGGNVLVSGTDYEVVGNDGWINAGNYTFTINGIGNYRDSKNGTFTIGKVTPTVVVPTANVLTYNGSAQELVTAGSTNFGTLKYSLDGVGYSTSIPTAINYGSYTVYYKVEGNINVNDVAPATIACSINEKQVTATVELSQDTYTYDGTAKEPTVTVKDGSTVIDPSEYSVTYSNNVNAGTATVTISDNVGGNYEVIGSATFTIEKANPSYIAPTATNPVYNTSAQALLVVGSTNDGTIQYSSDGSEWSSSLPQGTNAGIYTSYWKLVGDSNHNDVASTSISTTIAKASGSVSTAPVNTNYTYNGTAHAVASAGSGTGTMYYRLGTSGSFSTTMPTMTDAGSDTLYYYAAESTNYNQSSTSSITVSVQKASRTISFTTAPTSVNIGKTITVAATPSAGVGDGAITYSSNNTSKATVNGNVITGVATGTCTITATIAAGTNYLSASASYALSVEEYRVVAKFNVTSTSSPTIIGCDAYISGFSAIEIDGVVRPSVVSAYTFSTTGTHTIKYTLRDETSIGRYSFRGCTSLTSVSIPNGVTNIGNSSFDDCRSLTSVTIPNGITSIEDGAFYYCSGLTSINIPDSVTSIGEHAFYGCTSLPVTNNIRYADTCAVGALNNLSTYTFKSGTRYLLNTFDRGYQAVNNLTSITIPNTVVYIGNSTFYYCSGLTSVTIPNSVTSIAGQAFWECRSLTSVNIPSSVTSIGSSAFYNCSGLTSVTVNATTPPTLVSSSAFDGTNNCKIYVPSGSVAAYKAATNWSTYASRIQAKP